MVLLEEGGEKDKDDSLRGSSKKGENSLKAIAKKAGLFENSESSSSTIKHRKKDKSDTDSKQIQCDSSSSNNDSQVNKKEGNLLGGIDVNMLFPTQLKSYYASSEF